MNLAELTALAATAVGAAQRQLPPELRALARGVPVHYAALPDPSLLAEGFPADILGLFTGSAHGLELATDHPAPAQILLYLDNLWDFAEGDWDLYLDEVQTTYLHELGHYLGLDEIDLEERGLE